MDLSRLLRRPKIDYTPERVELQEPEPLETVQPETSYESVKDYTTDVRSMLEEEIANLQGLRDAVIEAVGPIEADVPPEMLDLVGKPKITMSDYLESLAGEDYGPIAIREVFEEHLSYSDPSGLAVSIIDDMQRDLQRDFEMLADDLFYGDIDPSGASDKALYAMRKAVADSVEMRREIAKASELAGRAIDIALWSHVLEANDVAEFRQKVSDITDSLKKIQGLLKMGTAIYSMDWKSLSSSLRDRLKGALMDQMMRKMFLEYNRAYNKMIHPLEPVLRFLGDSRASDIEEVQYLRSLIERPIEEIRTKGSEASTDLYAIRNKKSELRLHGAKAVGAMAYTWRLVSQLDLVIAAVSGLTGGQIRLEANAPQGALGRLMVDRRNYPLSPADKLTLTPDLRPLGEKVLSSLPEAPEFKP